MIFFCKIGFLYNWARVGRFLQIVGFYLELLEFSFEGSWTLSELIYEKWFNRRSGFMYQDWSSNLMQFSLWFDTFFYFYFPNAKKMALSSIYLFFAFLHLYQYVREKKKCHDVHFNKHNYNLTDDTYIFHFHL